MTPKFTKRRRGASPFPLPLPLSPSIGWLRNLRIVEFLYRAFPSLPIEQSSRSKHRGAKLKDFRRREQRFYHEFRLALVLTLRENRWKISCTFEFRCIGLGATTFCSDDKSDMIAEKRGQRGGGEISNSNVESASARLRSRVGLLNDWIGIEIEAVILFTIALLEIYIYSLHVRMRHWIPRGIANEPTRYFQRIAWHVEEETRARRVKRISFFYFFLSRAKIPVFLSSFPRLPFFSFPLFLFSFLFDFLATKLARG